MCTPDVCKCTEESNGCSCIVTYTSADTIPVVAHSGSGSSGSGSGSGGGSGAGSSSAAPVSPAGAVAGAAATGAGSAVATGVPAAPLGGKGTAAKKVVTTAFVEAQATAVATPTLLQQQSLPSTSENCCNATGHSRAHCLEQLSAHEQAQLGAHCQMHRHGVDNAVSTQLGISSAGAVSNPL